MLFQERRLPSLKVLLQQCLYSVKARCDQLLHESLNPTYLIDLDPAIPLYSVIYPYMPLYTPTYPTPYMSFSLNYLKGVIWGVIYGTTIRVTKGDTRS